MKNQTRLSPDDTGSHVSVFEKLDTRPVINACGIYTDLGGSILSETVWNSLMELNTFYIDMNELLEKTGRVVADLVHAEAARITPGASAGIALATGAVIAGNHEEHWEKLPDTIGMRDEIILQRPQANNYKYTNPIRLSGARIVLAGSNQTCNLADIRHLICSRTAAIFIPAHLADMDNVVPLKAIKSLADAEGVKLIVDAAYQVFPPEHLRDYAALGADLTIVSSKYYFGPNAGGFVSGKREMVDIVTKLDFTKFESGPYKTFGRAFKMGRYEVAAVCLALQEWFEADHDARWRGYTKAANVIVDGVSQISGLNARSCAFTFDETIEEQPVNAVLISTTPGTKSASTIISELSSGNPAVFVIPHGEDIIIVTETLRPGDDATIVQRLREINC